MTVRSARRASPSARLLLFATARTAVGAARLDWAVQPGGSPAAEILEQLGARYPAVRRVLRASRLYLNGELLLDAGEAVRPGDELAIHPPYGGG